jgi:uncharacterized membrane protein HdeD (DUF308 family)
MPIGLPADAAALRNHSTWFLIYGIVLALLGIGSILAPGLATLAVELTIGWMLLIGGAMGLVAVFSAGRAMPGFWWNLITSVVYVLAGLSLLTRPIAGIITLTIVLAAYLLAGGVVRIIQALGYRSELPSAWGWVLFSGVVDIVLALMIMARLPSTAAWVIGLMVGINLLMLGVAIIMAALAVRKVAS